MTQDYTIFNLNWISRELEGEPSWFAFDRGCGRRFDVGYWTSSPPEVRQVLKFDSEFPFNLDESVWDITSSEKPMVSFTFDEEGFRAFDYGQWDSSKKDPNEEYFMFDLDGNHRFNVGKWSVGSLGVVDEDFSFDMMNGHQYDLDKWRLM